MSIQTNYLDLDLIRIDGGTQSRAHLNQETIKEYADLFSTSHDILPPIRVFFDGKDYWNADGFHRLEAAKQANMKVIAAIIEQGTRRDAILFSVGANAEHGLRRTEDDKHRAVNTLLTDEEWNNWSDNQIAKKCKVSQPFVSKLRKKLNGDTGNVTRTYERNGKTHAMRTNNIGKPKTNQENLELDKNPNPEEMVEDNQTPPESENTTEQSQADTYNVISKEEKIATLNKRLDICQDEYAQKSIEYITDLEKQLEEANQKITDLTTGIKVKNEIIKEDNKQINKLTETNNQLFAANENLTKELNELKQKNTSLDEEVKKLNETISLKDQEIETLKNELKEANQKKTELDAECYNKQEWIEKHLFELEEYKKDWKQCEDTSIEMQKEFNDIWIENENLTKELNELKLKNTSLDEEVKKLNETISLKDNEFYKQRKIGELIGANNHQRDNLKKEQERNNKMRRCLIDIEVELETYLENAKKGDGIRINRTNSKKLLEKINQGYSPILHVEQKEGIE